MEISPTYRMTGEWEFTIVMCLTCASPVWRVAAGWCLAMDRSRRTAY